MNPAILSATSALVGSLVGGVSTLAASWFTQRGQLRAQVGRTSRSTPAI